MKIDVTTRDLELHPSFRPPRAPGRRRLPLVKPTELVALRLSTQPPAKNWNLNAQGWFGGQKGDLHDTLTRSIRCPLSSV